jgi:hypothetical protein
MRAYHDYYNTTINSTKQPSRQATAAREEGGRGGGKRAIGRRDGDDGRGGGGRKDAACALQHSKRPGVGRPAAPQNTTIKLCVDPLTLTLKHHNHL